MSLKSAPDFTDLEQTVLLSRKPRTGLRHPASIAGISMIACAVVVVGVLGARWFAMGPDHVSASANATSGVASVTPEQSSTKHCTGDIPEIRILAPERIEPVLTEAAAAACLSLAREDAPQGNAVLGRLAKGDLDAWISDSSEHAQAVGAPATELQPLFLSPILFTAPAPVAAGVSALGDDWRDLIRADAAAGFTFDFGKNAAAQPVLSSLVTRVAEQQTTGGTGSADQMSALVQKLSTLLKPAKNGPSIDVTERANTTAGTNPLTLGPLPVLDYPLIAAPGITNDQKALVDRLVSALHEMTPKQLNEFGYLSRDATTTGAGDELLLPHNPELFIATNAILDSDFMQGQLFVYMDVSGSMGQRDPGGISGIEAMQQSVQSLTQSMPGGMFVEWWSFGMNIGGETDQVLLDSGPLTETKSRLAETAAALQALPVGTPLYQTVVDGYRHTLEQSATTGELGMLVIVTDGKDEDAPDRLGRDEALAELTAMSATEAKLPILFLGFGDADMASMEEIVAITGGQAWEIDKPEELSAAIVAAITDVAAAQLQLGWDALGTDPIPKDRAE